MNIVDCLIIEIKHYLMIIGAFTMTYTLFRGQPIQIPFVILFVFSAAYLSVSTALRYYKQDNESIF